MFTGQHEHSIDDKSRLAIPSRFRRALEGGAFITKGLDGCLFLFAKAKWQKMAQSIGELPLSKSSARLYARLILAGAEEVEFDKQGRIIIPQYLKKYAKLSKNTMVIGIYDRVEVWSKENWEKMISKVEDQAGKIAEELSELGV